MALVVPVLGYVALLGILGVVAGWVPFLLGDTTPSTFTDSNGLTTETVNVQLGAASIAVMVIGYVLLFVGVISCTRDCCPVVWTSPMEDP